MLFLEIFDENEIDLFVQKVFANLKHKIILLYGEMGAGKTTLVKAFLRHWAPMEKVSSPTFSLVNEYLDSNGNKIYHMDLYRLENIEEALNIGIEDYLESGVPILIEWPQLIEPLLDDQHHKIQIELSDRDSRIFTFT